jgi:diguanylate cyclase (GGDEF)-like protein
MHRVLGIMGTELQTDERHLKVMNEIARIAGGELELRPMLAGVSEALDRHFGWEFIAFASVDTQGQRFICEAVHSVLPTEVTPGFNRPLSLGVVGEVARTGKPVFYDDVAESKTYLKTTEGIRAQLCVPVRHRGEVVAILNIESSRSGEFCDQLGLLETVADQVAGAIDNARVYAALREHTRVMEILNHLSRLATQGDDLHALLRGITDYLAAELQVAVASVLVLDASGRKFIIETMSGELTLGIPGGDEWPITVGVCGRCVRNGQPQLVFAGDDDPDYVAGHPDIQAEYVVPIRYRDSTLGVLNLESTERERFTPQVQNLCRAVADQIGGAIHIAIVNGQLAVANEKLKRANLELHRISSYDALTAVPNRRRFDEVLAHEWRWATRTGRPLTLLLADLDHFKALNDNHGHLRGDECLKLVAQALADGLMRPADFVARYGGEEFALVLPDMDLEQARGYAESLRARVEALRLPHGSSLVSQYVTLSIGVASQVAGRGVAASELLAAADAALYEAKRNGRNRIAGKI